MLASFPSIASSVFDPAINPLGFARIRSSLREVMYEGNRTQCFIYFDNGRSYELSVVLKLKGSTLGNEISLTEILEAAGEQEEAEAVEGLMVNDDAALAHCLRRLAVLTVAHGKKYLDGDEVGFARLSKGRSAVSDADERGDAINRATAQAQAAWKRKDFREVVAVLGPLGESLPPSDRRRLEIAKRYLKRG